MRTYIRGCIFTSVWMHFSLLSSLPLMLLAVVLAVLVFLLPTPWLFTFLPFCRSNCCHSRLYCSCYDCHHFSSMLIWPAGCSFFGLVSTDRTEMDAHWSFVKGKERQTPTNAFPFFCCFLFSLFFNVSLCPFRLSVICGSGQ